MFYAIRSFALYLNKFSSSASNSIKDDDGVREVVAVTRCVQVPLGGVRRFFLVGFNCPFARILC